MKYTIILLLFGLSITSKVLAQNYSLQQLEASYSDLENDTILSSGDWVGELYNFQLPFSVRIGNSDITRIYIFSDGDFYRQTGGQYRNIMYAYGNCGLKHRAGDSTSHISYVVQGESPNRIAKVQFKNVGFAGDETNTDFTNFQVWFYEGGLVNELIFGPTEMAQMRAFNGAYGPLLGMGNQIVQGTPASATLGTSYSGLNGVPGSGLKLRFFRQ